MAVVDKSEEFYRPSSGPISGPVSRSKRAKISVVEQGYRRSVIDPKLTVKLRIEALGHLACFNPPERFLARLVRKTDTPARLRLAATQLLQKTHSAATGLEKAEADARLVLERIRKQQAERSGKEDVESIFGGLETCEEVDARRASLKAGEAESVFGGPAASRGLLTQFLKAKTTGQTAALTAAYNALAKQNGDNQADSADQSQTNPSSGGSPIGAVLAGGKL